MTAKLSTARDRESPRQPSEPLRGPGGLREPAEGREGWRERDPGRGGGGSTRKRSGKAAVPAQLTVPTLEGGSPRRRPILREGLGQLEAK